MNDQEAPLLSVGETAERLNISERTVYRLIERADLPALRIGGSIRIDVEELRDYIYNEAEGVTR